MAHLDQEFASCSADLVTASGASRCGFWAGDACRAIVGLAGPQGDAADGLKSLPTSCSSSKGGRCHCAGRICMSSRLGSGSRGTPMACTAPWWPVLNQPPTLLERWVSALCSPWVVRLAHVGCDARASASAEGLGFAKLQGGDPVRVHPHGPVFHPLADSAQRFCRVAGRSPAVSPAVPVVQAAADGIALDTAVGHPRVRRLSVGACAEARDGGRVHGGFLFRAGGSATAGHRAPAGRPRAGGCHSRAPGRPPD